MHVVLHAALGDAEHRERRETDDDIHDACHQMVHTETKEDEEVLLEKADEQPVEATDDE